MSDIRRFIRKTRRTKSGCWRWRGAVSTWTREPWDGGYAAFWVGGRVVRGHRWIYEAMIGPISAGMKLLHSCDERRCVNPLHVTQGTQKQNVREMIERGRASRQRRGRCL